MTAFSGDSDTLAGSTVDGETLRSVARGVAALETAPTLTIAYHPDAHRIGEQSRLIRAASGWHAELSRLAPDFVNNGGGATGPLRHRTVSRDPVIVTVTDQVLRFAGTQSFKLDGTAAKAPLELPLDRLTEGLSIELSGGVILTLSLQRPASPPRWGMSGLSDAIATVREEIDRVAPLDGLVLIHGETGVGKELIARALHQGSKRREQRFVSVNMGALAKDTAAGELFGYRKGAFTGAVADHAGYFGLADGGTLFLDEIGETPDAVQPMLLRALESGEIQPLGTGKARLVDVRVVTATDANLPALVEAGRFRSALLHRLTGYRIEVPTLRQRREDIAPLFMEFLRHELQRLGAEEVLSAERAEPWLRSRIVMQLLSHHWPGNVRELRNVASQVAAFSAGLARSELPPALTEMGKSQPPAARPSDQPERRNDAQATAPPPHESDRPKPSEITDELLLATLKRNEWRIAATARDLGIAKNSLYELIERCPKIRKGRDIPKDEITAAQARHGSDTDAMAGELQVSVRALQLRMKELGLR